MQVYTAFVRLAIGSSLVALAHFYPGEVAAFILYGIFLHMVDTDAKEGK